MFYFAMMATLLWPIPMTSGRVYAIRYLLWVILPAWALVVWQYHAEIRESLHLAGIL